MCSQYLPSNAYTTGNKNRCSVMLHRFFGRQPRNFYKNLVIRTDMMYNKKVSGESAGMITGSLSKF